MARIGKEHDEEIRFPESEPVEIPDTAPAPSVPIDVPVPEPVREPVKVGRA